MKIVILAGKGNSTKILVNYLVDAGFKNIEIVLEEAVSSKKMVKFRIKKLGLLQTMQQLIFILVVVRILRAFSKNRLAQILAENKLRQTDIAASVHRYFSSINDKEVAEYLKNSGADIILVNGTRIIKNEILKTCSVPYVNTHAGITPAYRGVHGGYWALWNDDLENFGTTLHLVDQGVDTGNIISQVRIKPTPQDNFATYPLLQQAASLPFMVELLKNYEINGNLQLSPASEVVGKQWYHPSIIQYLTGLLRGVK